MLERFGEEARVVLSEAQVQAHDLRHNYVGTEHLLLGLFRYQHGAAARVLLKMGVDVDDAKAGVVKIVGLGTPREPDGAALATIGIDLDAVRRRAEEAFGEGALERTRAARDRKVIACGRRGRRLWRRDEACVGAVPLTPRAKKVLEFSVAEARDSGSERVRPEHVLLALLREREGVASEILRRAGIDYARAYRTIQDELHGP